MSALTTAVKLHISNATSFKKQPHIPTWKHKQQGKALQNYVVIFLKISFPYGKGRHDTAQPPDPITPGGSSGAPTSSAVHRPWGKVMTELEVTPTSAAERLNCGASQPPSIAWGGKRH